MIAWDVLIKRPNICLGSTLSARVGYVHISTAEFKCPPPPPGYGIQANKGFVYDEEYRNPKLFSM